MRCTHGTQAHSDSNRHDRCGKSTLINAIAGSETARTGTGESVTQKAESYNLNFYRISESDYCTLKLIDTQGFELNSEATSRTYSEIEQAISSSLSVNEKTIIWFCVNFLQNRIEDFSISTLLDIAVKYDVPIIIVLTQNLEGIPDELSDAIMKEFPEISVLNVLAKGYKLRGQDEVQAYGITELVLKSVNDYETLKATIHDKKRLLMLEQELRRLEEKIRDAERELEESKKLSEQEIARIRRRGKACIEDYSGSAGKISLIPIVTMPVVYGYCAKLMYALDDIAGVSFSLSAEKIFAEFISGIIFAPLMAIPLFGALVAASYVHATGEQYLDALIDLVSSSTKKQLKDKERNLRRLKEILAEKKRAKN